MQRTTWAVGMTLLCLGVATSPTPAKAMAVMPSPLPLRVAAAECVVVGKVSGFADRTVSAERFPGDKDKGNYQIAIVKVETNLHGLKKDVKEIKVGFIPPAPGGPGRPGGPIRPGFRPGRGMPVLTLNQEACLFLTRHHKGDFYILSTLAPVINKQGNTNFDKDVDQVKHCFKLLADPKGGLKAENKADRLLTANMLMTQFSAPKPSTGKRTMKPIDPELSKQILLVLADADWEARPAGLGGFMLTPRAIFGRFQSQLTEKDGWKPPKTPQEAQEFNKHFNENAKKWCKENADKYVIKRVVFEKEEK
jgi:hypothetical protein